MKTLTFDGATDVQQFLDTFEEVKEINGWTDRESAIHLRTALNGSATRGIPGRTYEEIKELLLMRYELTADEARRELRRMKPRKGENIYQIGEYIERMVKLGHPDLDAKPQGRMANTALIDSVDDWALERELKMLPPTNYTDTLRRIQKYNGAKGRSHAV